MPKTDGFITVSLLGVYILFPMTVHPSERIELTILQRLAFIKAPFFGKIILPTWLIGSVSVNSARGSGFKSQGQHIVKKILYERN